MTHSLHQRRWWTLTLVSTIVACDGSNLASPALATESRQSSAVIPDAPSTGGLLELAVADPKGDNSSPFDVRTMTLLFDNVSGAFSITLQTDPSAPFPTGGLIRTNINLYNPARSSFFQCDIGDFTLTESTQTLVLVGTSSLLTTWAPGDNVYTNSLKGTPTPPGSSEYHSSAIWNFDITSGPQLEDQIAFSNEAKPAKVARSKTTTVVSQGLACS